MMKEGQKKSLVVPASLETIPAKFQGSWKYATVKSQGKDMMVKGDLLSSDSTKCLSEAKGKEEIVGGDVSCCAGCLAAGGRDFLIQRIEALHEEISKFIGQLKICKCCSQQCGQGDVGPSLLDSAKEGQELSVDLDKSPDEIPWTIKEKKKRNGKGLLPRPNSSWVAGRTGFGLVGSKKAPVTSGPEVIGISASLGQTAHKPEVLAQPMGLFSGMSSTPDVTVPAVFSSQTAHEGRMILGQSSRATTAPAQPTSPTGMGTSTIVKVPAEASGTAEIFETMSLDRSDSEILVQSVSSPSGLRTTMDTKALAESSIVPAQPVPAELARYEKSTASVTAEMSVTDRGVIAQGNELRDTFVFKEVYRRRDGSTTTPVKGTGVSFLKEGSVLCMEESVSEGSVAGDPLGESSSCHPDSGGASKGLNMSFF